jgi:hypothetical protein
MSARVRTAMLGLAAIACNGDIQAVSWAPLDIDQLEDDMASPTAPLNDAAIAELQATPEDEITVIRGLLQVGRLIVETSGEGDMETETRDLDVNLSGTQVYIRIACPGPEGTTPDSEFRFGSLTFYSPGLSKTTIDTWGAQGDMLGVLEGCIVGQYTLDGEMRMFYDTIRDLLAAEFDIDWARAGAAGHFTLPAIDDRDAVDDTDVRAQVLFTLESGETLLLESNPDLGLTEYLIRGVDGEIVCDQANDPPCPPL